MVLESCGGDYLTNAEIKKSITAYFKLKVSFVHVVMLGNISINPFNQGFPILIKPTKETPPAMLPLYEYYKGGWYVIKGYSFAH